MKIKTPTNCFCEFCNSSQEKAKQCDVCKINLSKHSNRLKAVVQAQKPFVYYYPCYYCRTEGLVPLEIFKKFLWVAKPKNFQDLQMLLIAPVGAMICERVAPKESYMYDFIPEANMEHYNITLKELAEELGLTEPRDIYSDWSPQWME